MSSTSSNLGFELPDVSNTFGEWLNSFNANFNKIDAFPIGIKTGSGVSQRTNVSANPTWYWMQFNNGIMLQFTNVDFGTKYPCTQQWATTYASDKITLGFNQQFTNDDICILMDVSADKNPDMDFAVRYKHGAAFEGQFICSVNDASNVNSKTLSVLAIGRYK